VAQLSEEYDAHAIAAAALQMVYDQTRPSWMSSEQESQMDDRGMSNKPKLIKRPKPEAKSENTEVRRQKPEEIRN
jgi:ATP-dependent RNA helicase DeaD